jgi:hypothetical protein
MGRIQDDVEDKVSLSSSKCLLDEAVISSSHQCEETQDWPAEKRIKNPLAVVIVCDLALS